MIGTTIGRSAKALEARLLRSAATYAQRPRCSFASPDLSIQRTSAGRRRLPLVAPHVEP